MFEYVFSESTYTIFDPKTCLESVSHYLFILFKGTLSRDFRPLFFLIKQLHLGPWYTGKSLFAYGFVFAEICNLEINFGQKWSLFTPYIFCMNVVDIVYYNVPMYEFSIGIPFKSSQSMLNFEVPWSALSILVSGVIDTTHHRSVFVQTLYSWILSVTDTTQLRSTASLTLLITGRQCHCEIMLDWGQNQHQIFQSVDLDPVKKSRIYHPGQRCHWQRPPLVSGIIDTAYHKKIDFIVEYLRKYEVIIKKALTRGSRAQMELFDEKNHRSKISWQGPFKPGFLNRRFQIVINE
jgi:hypothetical protein